jgi:nucleotide-binding universal stress UspA family protein
MKNVLVLIHDDPGQEARFQVALDVTRAIGGHLTCLDVALQRVFPGDGMGGDAAVMMLEYERETETANKARLQQRLAVEDVAWNWIDTTGFLEPCLEEAASLCDLIVVSRHCDAFPSPDMDRAAAGLLVRAGKPILAVPDDAKGLNLGGTALSAWDGSRAASEAVAAAVPLLQLADCVTIVEVDDGSLEAPAEEAAAYLSRHGIHPQIVRVPAEGDPASSVILAKANSERYAWLVMGGFSHSRFVEALFGGVTRRMLLESPIPLFLAH